MILDEILGPDVRAECELAMTGINQVLLMGTVLCGAITDFIDARMPDPDGKA